MYENLTKKVEKGTYKHSLAPKMFKHLADAGAKMYTKEFGSSGDFIFSVAVRKEVAKDMADDFASFVGARTDNPGRLLKRLKKGLTGRIRIIGHGKNRRLEVRT